MTRCDEEFFVLKLADIVKAGLNAKIEDINGEKNDGVVLRNVDGSAYYYMTFGQTMPVYDPVVLFGVEPEETNADAGESSEKLSITIEMVLSSKLVGDSETLFKTLARYRRAIKETIRDGWRRSPVCTFTNLPNLAFTAGRDDSFFVVGVGISFTFPN